MSYDNLSELRNQLNQSKKKKDEIEFLYKVFLKGELILGLWKYIGHYFENNGSSRSLEVLYS